ncbi:hypothetical protein [Xylanimonas protaetiae]|uniref:Uncharacterized protein n=1 Tax=Xylanimonas protaetiae TaxID=2509457 RepID=A0A4P6F6I0_9MICO|nr:hypothetical protein [Xylanimonas protaetiae]QAY70393.1 hypothetical protein ET471_10410 [Xylanimonas protaetiae]
MSVRRSTGDIRDNVMFFSMARNLKDDPSFEVWIAKLWEFDFGLTVKYMRRHAAQFSQETIDIFNQMLTVNGKQRFVIERPSTPPGR